MIASQQKIKVNSFQWGRHELVLLITGAALVILMAAAAVLTQLPLILITPIVVALVLCAFYFPFWTYVCFLCMLSLIPIESRFLFMRVPNWTQALLPALLLGVMLNNVKRREARPYAFHWADLFLIAFIIFGFLGIKLEEGRATYKFFINQQVFPALLYFIVKWLPLDRKLFREQLRWQLYSVFALSAIMLCGPLLGIEPFYQGFQWHGFGGLARGPMYTISDTVAYTGIWPPFFLYAIATMLPSGRRERRWVWPAGLVLCILATVATTERTGPIALLIGFAICTLHPRMLKHLMIAGLGLVLLAPIYLATSSGGEVRGRLDTLGQQGVGFERQIYRQKALDYTRSGRWNPLLGTGFGRINDLSATTMSETQWVYDYNWNEFRPVRDFAGRPTHCAPVTLYCEYGYGAGGMLVAFAGAVGFGFLRIIRRGRRRRQRIDWVLITAALASVIGVVFNGLFHNTEGVVQVLFVMWAFAGLVIAHPDVFWVAPAEQQMASADVVQESV